MANVPAALRGMMDSAVPEDPEDYTDWQLDEETELRIRQHESDDTNTEADWELYTDETWED